MKCVYQTTNDNCYQACLASLLELPIEKIPIFNDYDEVRIYLESINYSVIFIPGDGHPLYDSKYPLGFSILNQETLKGTHSVICENGIIVHDPSPKPFSSLNFLSVLWSVIK